MELIVISPTRLKIMLTEPDMRRYALSADTAGCADGETRRSLRRLFDDARKETGFETEGARLLIQLYASRTGGCEIFVTKLGDQNAETEALSAPEEALLRRVFGNAPSGSGEGRAVSPEPARLTSSCPTCVGVPAPTETATRRTALLLPDTETLLRVCRRLSGLGYAQESSAYILDGGECCLFLRVPDTTFFRLPLAFAFLTEYGQETDAAHLSNYLSEHGAPLCECGAVGELGKLCDR